jgi:hypothetical protein
METILLSAFYGILALILGLCAPVLFCGLMGGFLWLLGKLLGEEFV